MTEECKITDVNRVITQNPRIFFAIGPNPRWPILSLEYNLIINACPVICCLLCFWQSPWWSSSSFKQCWAAISNSEQSRCWARWGKGLHSASLCVSASVHSKFSSVKYALSKYINSFRVITTTTSVTTTTARVRYPPQCWWKCSELQDWCIYMIMAFK